MPNSRMLLTTLSASPREAVYRYGGQLVAAFQSPVALIKLLPPDELPDKIIILCTEKLHNEQYLLVRDTLLEYYEQVSKSIGKLKAVDICEVLIPDGITADELWQILAEVLQSIPPNIPPKCELILDVTHGYRSFSFLYFTAALFLKALHEVDIKAVYYSMVDTNLPEKPIIDLSLLLDMVEWFYATRIFRQTGQASPLCELLHPFEEYPPGLKSEEEYRAYGLVKDIRKSLESVSAAYAQALPLELGNEAEKLLQKIVGPIPGHVVQKIPLADQLFASVQSFAQPFAFTTINTIKEKKQKRITLTQTELERQATIIDSYLEQGYINYALGMIREWMVSCAIWNQNSGTGSHSAEWLVMEKRNEFEDKLSYLTSIYQASERDSHINILSPEQCWLSGKWDFLSQKRNQLAHHGFAHGNVLQSAENMQEIRTMWAELKEYMTSPAHWNLSIASGQGTLLISPLGLSKGLLFSALSHFNPNRLCIVTSATSADSLKEIAETANWSGTQTLYIMKDPFTGFDEAEAVFKAFQSSILSAEQIVINITGGTTAMQHVIQQVARRIERFGKDMQLYAFADRRSPDEQRENPYVLGEIISLNQDH